MHLLLCQINLLQITLREKALRKILRRKVEETFVVMWLSKTGIGTIES